MRRNKRYYIYCSRAHKKFVQSICKNLRLNLGHEKLLTLIVLLNCTNYPDRPNRKTGTDLFHQPARWNGRTGLLSLHTFGPNTFTDLEWGKGTETEDMFNPPALIAGNGAALQRRQVQNYHHHRKTSWWVWFCVSQYSKHTVAQSKWKDGKGVCWKN